MIPAWYKGAATGSVERLLRLVQVAQTEAYYLAETGDLNALQSLYSEGHASIHDVDPSDGGSALHCALRSYQNPVVEFLICNGADVMQQDFSNLAPRDLALAEYFDPGRSSLRREENTRSLRYRRHPGRC